jgi:hypothetical protein
MKKHLILLAVVAIASSMYAPILSAQATDGHQHEVGLNFYGLNFNGSNSFSAIYKKKLAEGKFRRISGTFGGINFQRSTDHQLYFNINAGLSIGREKRKAVGRKTMFYSGPEFSIGTSFSKSEKIKPTWNMMPSIGYILGIQHDFNEYWGINLEIVPGGGISVSKYSGQDIAFSVQGNFSSTAALGLIYKF